MRWRDIRFEKPTAADGDNKGHILQRLDNGSLCIAHYNSLAYMVAWLPLSELPAFDRIPDPPDGWRFVEPGEVFDERAKFWRADGRFWSPVFIDYDSDTQHIVPIAPPEPLQPTYRPYNAAELYELIGKVVHCVSGHRAMITGVSSDKVYCQGQSIAASDLLASYAWLDGGPCGVQE